MEQATRFIGLDVHKETTAVALAEGDQRGTVCEYGKIADTPAAVMALAAKLARTGRALQFCYEAAPCGYGIQPQLTLAEHGCRVGAPSLIPRKPRGPDQDGSERCDQSGQAASGRGADAGLGSRSPA